MIKEKTLKLDEERLRNELLSSQSGYNNEFKSLQQKIDAQTQMINGMSQEIKTMELKLKTQVNIVHKLKN